MANDKSEFQHSTESYAVPYRISPDSPLPLTVLFDRDGRSFRELVVASGYKNLQKAMNLLTDLAHGDVHHKVDKGKSIVARALGISETEVQRAIDDGEYIKWARRDRDARRRFKPYVQWLPEPQSYWDIFGRDRPKGHLDLPDVGDRSQAVACVVAHVEDFLASIPPRNAFDRSNFCGFRIHYTPDESLSYDLSGNVMDWVTPPFMQVSCRPRKSQGQLPDGYEPRQPVGSSDTPE